MPWVGFPTQGFTDDNEANGFITKDGKIWELVIL